MKNSFLYALFYTLLFALGETFFRLGYDNLENFLKPRNYGELFLLFLFLSFVPRRLARIFVGFLLFLFFAQALHFGYFGYFFFPVEWILLVTKWREVLETGVTKLELLWVPSLLTLLMGLGAVAIERRFADRPTPSWTKYLFVLFLVVPVLKTGIHYKKRALGERPKTGRTIVMNSLYLSKTFLGKTLPMYLLDLQIVPRYAAPDLRPLEKAEAIERVVLIVGESLSAKYMGLYGYEKPTTPRLEALAHEAEGRFYALEALSSGLFTDSSIPMFLNVEKRPNAIEDILSGRTNLFRLAKERGYATVWISAQASDTFGYIRSYMGLKYIDLYIDPASRGADRYTAFFDTFLLDELKKLDFSKKAFVVLNMIGSHEPYETRVPAGFHRLFRGEGDLSNYLNSILFTDEVVAKIVRYVRKLPGRSLVVFTSDHGQHVTATSCGKGNFRDERDYVVPLVVVFGGFAPSPEISEALRHRRISHFDMSLLVARALGYDALGYADYKKAFINGRELSGNDGYAEYDIPASRIVKIY